MKLENWATKNTRALLHNGVSLRLACYGLVATSLIPTLALAGASPFTTGTTALSTNILAILTPVAVIGVMALGAAAWFNKISWGWAAGGIVGMCLVFGGQQIVTWVRGLFGV